MSKEKTVKTNAMRILEKYKINYKSASYECDEFIDGVHTADLLGLDHDKVYKTLVTIGKSKNYFVYVIPIEAELDLKKAAKAVGEKSIEMLPLKDVTNVTGYVRGGCTAIGMKKQYKTVLDESALKHESFHISGGKIGLQLELAPNDFIKAASAITEDIIMH